MNKIKNITINVGTDSVPFDTNYDITGVLLKIEFDNSDILEYVIEPKNEKYVKIMVRKAEKNQLTCPVCNNPTIDNEWDICYICFWEYDPYQNTHTNSDMGANHVSLEQAKKNYKEFGASEHRFINLVHPYEKFTIKTTEEIKNGNL